VRSDVVSILMDNLDRLSRGRADLVNQAAARCAKRRKLPRSASNREQQ
jgi:hypothetical protein